MGGRGIEDLENHRLNRNIIGVPMAELNLRQEIIGIHERIKSYEEQIKKAQRIVIFVGCDDGRVGVPGSAIDINGESVLFIYVPKIGGGVVEATQIRSVYDFCISLGVSPESISVITTQHGNDDEVKHAISVLKNGDSSGFDGHETCGLRAALAKAGASFGDRISGLSDLINTHRDMSYGGFIGKMHDDRQDDIQGKQLAQLKELVDDIAEHLELPPRLIWIAITKNNSNDMSQNLNETTNYLRELLADLRIDIEVKKGLYNHTFGEVVVIDGDADLKIETINFGLEDSHHPDGDYDHQDPRVLVGSIGDRFFIPDGVVLPESVGVVRDNDFSAAALGRSVEDVLDVLAELFYAAHTKAVGGHGNNFEHSQAIILICDSENEVDLLYKALESDEFKETMRQDFMKAFGKVDILNIEKESLIEYDLN